MFKTCAITWSRVVNMKTSLLFSEVDLLFSRIINLVMPYYSPWEHLLTFQSSCAGASTLSLSLSFSLSLTHTFTSLCFCWKEDGWVGHQQLYIIPEFPNLKVLPWCTSSRKGKERKRKKVGKAINKSKAHMKLFSQSQVVE